MKKGFTLIELLAVIVILAIIALIATPIILGIINDAREKANERSVELYASAIRNGIAAYQLREVKEVSSGSYTSETLPFDVEYDGDVECTTIDIYEDGKMYVAECTVNDNDVEYTYGTKQELLSKQVYKPQYYSWAALGSVGEDLPSDAKSTVSELNPSYSFYLGFDVDSNNKVIAGYVCFKRNDVEYYLKGADAEAYATNVDIIRDAYSDVVNTEACSFETDSSYCGAGGLNANAESYGAISASDGTAGTNCNIGVAGYFECY